MDRDAQLLIERANADDGQIELNFQRRVDPARQLVEKAQPLLATGPRASAAPVACIASFLRPNGPLTVSSQLGERDVRRQQARCRVDGARRAGGRSETRRAPSARRSGPRRRAATPLPTVRPRPSSAVYRGGPRACRTCIGGAVRRRARAALDVLRRRVRKNQPAAVAFAVVAEALNFDVCPDFCHTAGSTLPRRWEVRH